MSRMDLLGRLLLSVAIISVAMAPLTADLNETHIFNEEWPPHARFHTAVLMFLSIGLSLIGLWLLWRKSSEFRTHVFLAMLIPLTWWLSVSAQHNSVSVRGKRRGTNREAST